MVRDNLQGSSPNFVFKYNGIIDWKHIYRESKEFWLRIVPDEWDLVEKVYKHKGSKVEVKWEVTHNYDAYYQLKYTVWFKIIKPRQVFIEKDGKKKEMMSGHLRCWFTFSWTEDYGGHSLAGHSTVFRAQWLKAIYRKVTWRERWDLVDDIGLFTCNDFIQLLGKLCGTDAQGYGSIWEPG